MITQAFFKTFFLSEVFDFLNKLRFFNPKSERKKSACGGLFSSRFLYKNIVWRQPYSMTLSSLVADSLYNIVITQALHKPLFTFSTTGKCVDVRKCAIFLSTDCSNA